MELGHRSDDAASPPPKSILVLGPHRSGTSALTRVLNLLGVDLGSEMLPPKFDNQHGYWEHRAVFELQERLLSRVGSSWHDYRPMPLGWRQLKDTGLIRDELVAVLGREFRGKSLWGVKDPRLCRLVPLWLDILDQLGTQALFVIIVRNPLEVASSLERRNQFSHGKSLLLCLSEMLSAIVNTEGERRAFVSYERVLSDWRQVVDDLGRELGITWPHEPSSRAQEIDAFLRPSERHHRFDTTELRTDPSLPSWAVELYEALERASRGDDEGLSDRAQNAYDAFVSSAALFVPELDHLSAENARLSAEIATLRGQDLVAERARLEHRAEMAEDELNKVQRHLTSILSSPMYRSTRRIRQAWRGLARFRH